MSKKGKESKSSLGLYKTTNKKILNAAKRERGAWVREINVLKAWKNGGNPWVTINNPNKNETNKRLIRVRMNDLKHGSYAIIKKGIPVAQ